MEKETMLVTQGLNELKTLDARINRAINDAAFVVAAKTKEAKVAPNKTKDEFIANAKASMDSINALIERREKIKAAIIESNAKTEVELCGQKLTVAKVIDMKTSMGYHNNLYHRMLNQFQNAVAIMNNQNTKMEEAIANLVATAFGKESKTKIGSDDYESIADPYRKNNEYSLVDPLDIEKKMKAELDFIEEFNAKVDQVLQVSNCVTYIEL